MSKVKGCGLAEMINADDLQAMASLGMTPAEVADFYGCSRQNLVNIMKQNPHLRYAFDTGLKRVLVRAAKVLINKLDKDDTLSAMFILKCRGGWVEEQHRKEKESDDKPRVSIYLPHNSRDDQSALLTENADGSFSPTEN